VVASAVGARSQVCAMAAAVPQLLARGTIRHPLGVLDVRV